MSAVMTMAEPDCLHMVTCGAAYDEYGTYLFDWQKTLPVPGANAVFATRGPIVAYPAFLIALQAFEYDDFDSLRRQITQVCERCDALMDDDTYEIIIAGWSKENARGEVLYRQNHHNCWHKTEAGVTYQMGERAGFGVAIADKWDRDLVLRRFEEARAHPNDLSCGRDAKPTMGCAVGGKVWHAVVRPDAEPTFEVMQEWPDVVGEKLNARPALTAAA